MKKKILVAIGLIVTIIIVIVVFSWALIKDTSRVNSIKVVVVPNDSSVVIDGKSGKAGVNNLNPGSHQVLVWKNGFSSQLKKIDLKDSIEVLYFGLVPQSSEALKWSEKNQTLYAEIESMSGEKISSDGEHFATKYPITKHLPFSNIFLRIDYRLNLDQTITVEIRANSPTDRQYAVRQILNWGIQPGGYDIDFIGFKNPLGEI